MQVSLLPPGLSRVQIEQLRHPQQQLLCGTSLQVSQRQNHVPPIQVLHQPQRQHLLQEQLYSQQHQQLIASQPQQQQLQPFQQQQQKLLQSFQHQQQRQLQSLQAQQHFQVQQCRLQDLLQHQPQLPQQQFLQRQQPQFNQHQEQQLQQQQQEHLCQQLTRGTTRFSPIYGRSTCATGYAPQHKGLLDSEVFLVSPPPAANDTWTKQQRCLNSDNWGIAGAPISTVSPLLQPHHLGLPPVQLQNQHFVPEELLQQQSQEQPPHASPADFNETSAAPASPRKHQQELNTQQEVGAGNLLLESLAHPLKDIQQQPQEGESLLVKDEEQQEIVQDDAADGATVSTLSDLAEARVQTRRQSPKQQEKKTSDCKAPQKVAGKSGNGGSAANATPKPSCFEILYQDALHRRTRQLRAELGRDRATSCLQQRQFRSQTLQCTTRIYHRTAWRKYHVEWHIYGDKKYMIKRHQEKISFNEALKRKLEVSKREDEGRECTFKPVTWSLRKPLVQQKRRLLRLEGLAEQQQVLKEALFVLQYEEKQMDEYIAMKLQEEMGRLRAQDNTEEKLKNILHFYRDRKIEETNRHRSMKLDLLTQLTRLDQQYKRTAASGNLQDDEAAEAVGFDLLLSAKVREDIMEELDSVNSLRSGAKFRAIWEASLPMYDSCFSTEEASNRSAAPDFSASAACAGSLPGCRAAGAGAYDERSLFLLNRRHGVCCDKYPSKMLYRHRSNSSSSGAVRRGASTGKSLDRFTCAPVPPADPLRTRRDSASYVDTALQQEPLPISQLSGSPPGSPLSLSDARKHRIARLLGSRLSAQPALQGESQQLPQEKEETLGMQPQEQQQEKEGLPLQEIPTTEQQNSPQQQQETHQQHERQLQQQLEKAGQKTMMAPAGSGRPTHGGSFDRPGLFPAREGASAAGIGGQLPAHAAGSRGWQPRQFGSNMSPVRTVPQGPQEQQLLSLQSIPTAAAAAPVPPASSQQPLPSMLLQVSPRAAEHENILPTQHEIGATEQAANLHAAKLGYGAQQQGESSLFPAVAASFPQQLDCMQDPFALQLQQQQRGKGSNAPLVPSHENRAQLQRQQQVLQQQQHDVQQQQQQQRALQQQRQQTFLQQQQATLPRHSRSREAAAASWAQNSEQTALPPPYQTPSNPLPPILAYCTRASASPMPLTSFHASPHVAHRVSPTREFDPAPATEMVAAQQRQQQHAAFPQQLLATFPQQRINQEQQCASSQVQRGMRPVDATHANSQETLSYAGVAPSPKLLPALASHYQAYSPRHGKALKFAASPQDPQGDAGVAATAAAAAAAVPRSGLPTQFTTQRVSPQRAAETRGRPSPFPAWPGGVASMALLQQQQESEAGVPLPPAAVAAAPRKAKLAEGRTAMPMPPFPPPAAGLVDFAAAARLCQRGNILSAAR